MQKSERIKGWLGSGDTDPKENLMPTQSFPDWQTMLKRTTSKTTFSSSRNSEYLVKERGVTFGSAPTKMNYSNIRPQRGAWSSQKTQQSLPASGCCDSELSCIPFRYFTVLYIPHVSRWLLNCGDVKDCKYYQQDPLQKRTKINNLKEAMKLKPDFEWKKI